MAGRQSHAVLFSALDQPRVRKEAIRNPNVEGQTSGIETAPWVTGADSSLPLYTYTFMLSANIYNADRIDRNGAFLSSLCVESPDKLEASEVGECY